MQTLELFGGGAAAKLIGPACPVGSDLACLSLSFHRNVGIDLNVFE